MAESLRLVAWNIRAGGGKRADGISNALVKLRPHAIVLCEFRSTPPSQSIAVALADAGLKHQLANYCEVPPGKNSLLIAAREPIKLVRLRKRPVEPGRWLMARLQISGFAIGGMHIPNQHTGRKPGYHDAVVDMARRWRHVPAVLMGDTNSGQIGIDEETPVFNRRTHNWFEKLGDAGWTDGFRHFYPERREYTWYSHRGNGFRLDQAFLSRPILPRLRSVQHRWLGATGKRRDALSDHAALIVDFDPSSP